jgi:hypothetical protein
MLATKILSHSAARCRATQLGLILSLAAQCGSTSRRKNFIACVNGLLGNLVDELLL